MQKAPKPLPKNKTKKPQQNDRRTQRGQEPLEIPEPAKDPLQMEVFYRQVRNHLNSMFPPTYLI